MSARDKAGFETGICKFTVVHRVTTYTSGNELRGSPEPFGDFESEDAAARALVNDPRNFTKGQFGWRGGYSEAVIQRVVLYGEPDMIAPLAWVLVGDNDFKSGEYSMWLFQAKPTPKPVWVLYMADQLRSTHDNKNAANAAANAHHRAAIMAAFNGEAKT